MNGHAGLQLSCETINVHTTEKATLWSGTATAAAPKPSQPAVCNVVECVQFELVIDLPKAVWEKPGGVLVAIRWPDSTNILNLFVYQSGSQTGGDVQVASSLGILAASAGGVLLRNAPNGHYKVYVALDPSGSVATSVPFEGEAMVQFDPKVRPVRPLRPDFEMGGQTHVGFDTPSFPFFGDPDPAPGETCFASEKAEDGAQNCLRFDQSFSNVGEGPAELRFRLPHDPANTSHDVFQRTYFSDAPSHVVDTLAGTWEFHAAHGHYHYDNFAQSNLWAVDKKGRRTGAAPVGTGRKVSFCVEDESLDATLWGKKGVGPRTYRAPDCLFAQVVGTDFDYLVQGLTPGWTDVYQWYIPGQYIEVTGVPDGDYILETVVDPDHKVIEANESNNCGSVRVHLSRMGTPGQSAQLLGPGPSCKD